MSEKRVLFAALLSAAFLAWYSSTFLKPAPATRTSQGAAQAPRSSQPAPTPVLEALDPETMTSLESEDLRFDIGTSTGAVRHVTLKRFSDSATGLPLRFGGAHPIFQLRVGEEPDSVRWLRDSDGAVEFELIDKSQATYQLTYALNRANGLMNIVLHLRNSAEPIERAVVRIRGSWTKGDGLSGRYNALEGIFATQPDRGDVKHKKYLPHPKTARTVPRGTFLATLSERHFCQSIKLGQQADAVSLLPAPNGIETFEAITTVAQAPDGLLRYAATLYVGPRDYFWMKRVGFEQAIPIGVIGQIGLILLLLLKGIASVVMNYGVAIIFFSLLVTLLTAPLTLVSMRSMKKMQQLKPQVDRIMAQHKQDQMKANQAIFALYKEHRVSPMSGCLPILLQMPVFIALFQAMSHFIDLRGGRFLWIRDLSLPDRLAELPMALPVIGREINLLPIIMAAAMYVQTKLTQAASPQTEGNPTMKILSGPLMPILFCFMFYSFPSGLVLYWLTNTAASVAIYRLAK